MTRAPQLLGAKHVAERLSISRSAAQRLLTSGEMPTIRLGTSLRVGEDVLTDYLARHTTPTARSRVRRLGAV